MVRVEVATWRSYEAPERLHVRVTLDDGNQHRRTLSEFSDSDVRDLRVAAGFWRHGDRIAARARARHLDDAAADRLAAAVLVDQCLAIEALFPHLRERLPA